VLSLVVLAVSINNELNAQTTISGGLTGVVTDQSGAAVTNADIKITDNAKAITQSTKSDREGVYRFFFLAPARYTLTASHEGFQTTSRAVDVLLGPPSTVNVALEIARATNEITVTDEAPLVQAESGDVSATVNQKQISEVPNPGNDLTYIAQTAPGVVMNTDTQGNANFSILGMPGTSYFYTIDGVNQNDNAINLSNAGDLFLFLGQNQIQEATVVSTGYSGQFGGAAGGNINYVTKSGGNEFHGNAQYYWNGRVLNANDWFLNATGKPRPPDIANQWAGSLGGPVTKEKLFFFFDIEGQQVLIPQVFFVTIPSPQFEAATIAQIDSKFGADSASDSFYKKIFNLYHAAPGVSSSLPGGFSSTDPLGCAGFQGASGLGTTVPCSMHFTSSRGRPSHDALISGRADWIASKNDRASLRLQYEVGRGAIVTDAVNSLFDADGSGPPWWQGQFIETHLFGTSASSQFLLAGSYGADSETFEFRHPAEALAAFPTALNFVQGPFTNLAGASWFAAFGVGRVNTQAQMSEDVFKAWRSHKFGFGANLTRIYWTELPNKVNATGQLNVQTLDAFYQGGVDPASPAIDFSQLTQSFTREGDLRISFLNFGIYAQDEWKIRPNLALTLALRGEHYSNPICRSACFARLAAPLESISHDPNTPYDQAVLVNENRALQETDKFLWSPRFSFAWQPLGLAKNSVIRGGVGTFYDPLPYRILDSFSGNTPLYNSFTVFGDNLAPGESTNLYRDAAASNAAFLHGFATGQTLSEIQGAIPNFFPPALNVAERRLHFPQYQRWSLEWQQAFGATTSVSIGYFGHHGKHELVQNSSRNAFGFGSLPATLCTSPPVLPCADPRFSQVTELKTTAVSNYNGAVVSFKHRFSGWTQGLLQANYTYGHVLDEVSNGGLFTFSSVGSLSPQDPNDLQGAYGPAEYDVRHSLNASYIWEIPVNAALRGHGLDALVKGWQISGTIFVRTGFPYTVFDFAESGNLVPNNYFGAIYAVPIAPLGSGPSCGEGAAAPLSPRPCQLPQFLPNGNPSPNARFVQTGCETDFNRGNLPGPSGACSGPTVIFAQGRNRFRGPAYFNTDFTVMKNMKVPGWEKGLLALGLQFFNFLNHPNFGFPDPGVSDATFGQIFNLEQPPTSVLGSGFGGDAAPRMIQLKIQLQF
jgi:hypothetical protein